MIATRTLHIVIGSLSTRLSQPNRHIALNMLLKQVFVVLLFVMPNSMNGRDVSQQITASDINTVLNRLDSLVAKQKLIYEKREKKITEMETIHQVECTDSIKAYLALADSMRTYCIRYSLKYATQADKMAKKRLPCNRGSNITSKNIPQNRAYKRTVPNIERYRHIQTNQQTTV